jgi:hypothetical protein
MRYLTLLFLACGTAFATCSITITAPTNGATLSGPSAFTAQHTTCPSAVRHEWRVNGQPLTGEGTFESSYSIPTADGVSSYSMPGGFGPFNASYLFDGTYPLTVLAEDASGAVLATSAAINFTINDQAFGQCSLTSPNFAVAQSGTITITVHCPLSGVPGSSPYTNATYYFYVDGKFLSEQIKTSGYPDGSISFDTTTLENGTNHQVWVAVASSQTGCDNCSTTGTSPLLGAFGLMTTSNTAAARELRMNFKTSYLWLGGTANVSLFARTVNDDNTEAATNATFTTDTPSVATVGSCTLVASCTITGIAAGQAIITATAASGLTATTQVNVQAGTPIFPHFGYDGSICTVYNSGGCSPNKSEIMRDMFDANSSTGGLAGLAAAELAAGFNVFESQFYYSPQDVGGIPTLATWKVFQDGNATNPANAGLATGFKSFLGRGDRLISNGGQYAQSTADTVDTGGFAARMFYIASKVGGKVIGVVNGDEIAFPLIAGNGTGQMGSTNGPSSIVVSGGVATMTWVGLHKGSFKFAITGATNTCFNSTANVFGGSDNGPFTFATSCANGTYNSGTDPSLTVQIYDEIGTCPSTGCANLAPLNIAVPNSVFATLHSNLQSAFSPPLGMDLPWQGGAPKSTYAIGATVQDWCDVYWTNDGPEFQAFAYGLPTTRTVRQPLLSMETHFWTKAWPGCNNNAPYILEISGAGVGPWYSRGGKTFTLGATSGAQLTTTTTNNAAVGSRVTVTGSSVPGFYTVASVQSSTQFTVSGSPGFTGSGGTAIIASTNQYFTPPMDRAKRPGLRGIDLSAQVWDCLAIGCAGYRLFTFNGPFATSNFNDYPANTAQDAYVANNVPPNAPNNESNDTGINLSLADHPSSPEHWNTLTLTQRLIAGLEPEIICPMGNAPDFGPRVHTGAKVCPTGTLVFAISDSEMPSTLNFPASLWSLYNNGTAPITRLQQIKAAYVNVNNLASNTTADSHTVDGGEVDL